MPNLTEISRRFRSFLCTSNSTVENTTRPSQITNVGAVTRNVNSVWEEKQILLLQKLSDFTYVSMKYIHGFIAVLWYAFVKEAKLKW